MTPKEKAEELVNKFYNYTSCEWWEGELGHKENMKQCALIAVDEIIKALPPFEYGLEFVAKIVFWNEVKQEIEKL
jgi:hypothetical protein